MHTPLLIGSKSPHLIRILLPWLNLNRWSQYSRRTRRLVRGNSDIRLAVYRFKRAGYVLIVKVIFQSLAVTIQNKVLTFDRIPIKHPDVAKMVLKHEFISIIISGGHRPTVIQ